MGIRRRLRIVDKPMAVALALLLAGCGNILRDKGLAADAMDTFHERFNSGEADKIYDTADRDFQSKTVRADFLKFLGDVHARLGDYRHCASQDWKTNTFNGDTTVQLRYKTEFANGEATETFRYHVAGTRATLREYHISSQKLGDY